MEDLLGAFGAFYEDLFVHIARIRPTTVGYIATYIDELAFLLAGRTGLGGSLYVYGISAFVTFPGSHSFSPSHVFTALRTLKPKSTSYL